MRLVGLRLPGDERTLVASLMGSTVRVLTELTTFWEDAPSWVAQQMTHTLSSDPIQLSSVKLVPLAPPSARVLCIGLNYRSHAAEGSFEVPEYPTIFGRWTASLTAGDAPAWVPAGEDGLDWEGEVAAYIGERLHDVTPDRARAAVIGYSTFNDLTARRAQKLTTQWTLGKNADRSGPIGPLVTSDEVGDLRDGLGITTTVNDEIVQQGNTRDMIFELGEVLALLSRTFTLNPGDVIATGTPEGVGYVRNPPRLLSKGDVVTVEVERLGALTTRIIGRP